MPDYTDFDFSLFSDLELVSMQSESRKIVDLDFVNAVLTELGRRQKARLSTETAPYLKKGAYFTLPPPEQKNQP